MADIHQARDYERQYHKEVYENHELFTPGTWLHRPATYAVQSFSLIPKHAHVRALDLGGGVGRHSIPLAQYLGASSEVVCVDLLDFAIERLKANAQDSGVMGNIIGEVADVEEFAVTEAYFDYILSVSCIEHLPTKASLGKLIQRLQRGTTHDGIHCFMIITNNEWVETGTGLHITPLIEQNLTSNETITMLKDLYDTWKIHDLSTKDWEATQPMDGRDVTLKSTCVQFTAQNMQS